MSDPPPSEHQERSTPFSPEAEEAVLGAILSNPGAWFGIAAFLQQDDFFLLRHRWIWEAMQRISERNENLDFLTVGEELAQLGHLEETGGTAWLIRLINNTPTSVHAEVYGRIVQRAALRRRLLAAAESIRGVALDEQQTIESVIEQSEALVFEATENRTRRDLLPISVAISDYYERIEYLIRHSDTPLGLPTGFRAVEQLLGGMQRSDLLVFAGRPGMGKTSFHALGRAQRRPPRQSRGAVHDGDGRGTDRPAPGLHGNRHQHAAAAPRPGQPAGAGASAGGHGPAQRFTDLH